MSVIRIRKARQKPYVILDVTALNDQRLSFRAKGIHTYLMAKPDDWQVHIDQLEKESPREARDAVRVAMKELEDCGYIRRIRIRGAHGRMLGWDTTVYETPLLARQEQEDDALAGAAIGLSSDDPPIADYPKSDRPKSVQPKSANPLSVEPAPTLDSSFSPKTDSPKSANPSLLSIDSTKKENTIATSSKPRRKVAFPPPDHLQPSQNLIAWHQREFPQYDLPDAIESCLDHYRKKGEQASDYEAAVRNWFRNGHKYGTLKRTKRERGFVQ